MSSFILIPVPSIFYYLVQWRTNEQLIDSWTHTHTQSDSVHTGQQDNSSINKQTVPGY